MILPATHGSYIGVEESPGHDIKMVDLTIDVINSFLTGNQAF
jgi:hypothetical protein